MQLAGMSCRYVKVLMLVALFHAEDTNTYMQNLHHTDKIPTPNSDACTFLSGYVDCMCMSVHVSVDMCALCVKYVQEHLTKFVCQYLYVL